MLLLLEAYAPVIVPRYSGGKRIAAYTVSEDGKLKREMDRLNELQRKQDEDDAELVAALLAWWEAR